MRFVLASAVAVLLAVSCGAETDSTTNSNATTTPSATVADARASTSTVADLPTAPPQRQLIDGMLLPEDFEAEGIGVGWQRTESIELPAESNDPSSTICGTHYDNAHPLHHEAVFATDDGLFEATQLIMPVSPSTDPWIESLAALANCEDVEPEYENASFSRLETVVEGAAQSITVTGTNNVNGPDPVPTTIVAATFDRWFLILSIATTGDDVPDPATVADLLRRSADELQD